jgi:predicted DNA-binding protein YlxM (UPF0122 family)
MRKRQNEMPLIDVSNEELKAAYNAPGATLQTLATTFQCSREAVRQRLKKIGVARRPPGSSKLHRVRVRIDRQRFTPTDQQRMAVMYADDSSLQEIASIFNTTAMTVMRYLELAGVERRSRGPREKAKITEN